MHPYRPGLRSGGHGPGLGFRGVGLGLLENGDQFFWGEFFDVRIDFAGIPELLLLTNR